MVSAAKPLEIPIVPHRVRRTFGFIDLSDFTEFANTHGDEIAVNELATFRAIVRSVGSSTGVRIAKWLGDGAMLVGLEPVGLVSAVITILGLAERHGLALRVHAGIAEGDVILFEGDDHVGSTVNLAARLESLAKPGQVLAPAGLLPGVSRSHALQGAVEVDGFRDPVQVADLALVPQLVESLDL